METPENAFESGLETSISGVGARTARISAVVSIGGGISKRKDQLRPPAARLNRDAANFIIKCERDTERR
jgi:hypothetical protein